MWLALPIIVKMTEDWFRNYLISCEYMQIDPSKVHDLESIRQRTEYVISQWTDCRETLETLEATFDTLMRNVDPEHPNANLELRLRRNIENNKERDKGHVFRMDGLYGNFKPRPVLPMMPMHEGLAMKCALYIKQGKMTLQPGTVNETYEKKELRQDNYDNYAGKKVKWPN